LNTSTQSFYLKAAYMPTQSPVVYSTPGDASPGPAAELAMDCSEALLSPTELNAQPFSAMLYRTGCLDTLLNEDGQLVKENMPLLAADGDAPEPMPVAPRCSYEDDTYQYPDSDEPVPLLQRAKQKAARCGFGASRTSRVNIWAVVGDSPSQPHAKV
jgi:hypothetical protein